ncbi:MAG: sensor histidine kinase [Synechococcus sp. TMED20]|nr:MAG: sensor histidine kinase [Synechococcus sp. TMED20]
MPLTDRFLGFSDRLLSALCQKTSLRQLALYLSRPEKNPGPALELVRQWPRGDLQLPAVERDPDLRLPSPDRRWYPLQDGSLILGALRAEIPPEADWSPALDERLRSTAVAISHGLTLDLECLQLRQELIDQRRQTQTLVHQLRNPLSALRTYAQLLLRRMEPDSQHRELVEGMLSEQTQLGRYINALDGLNQDVLPAAADPGSPLLLPPGLSSSPVSLQEQLRPLIDRAAATASLQGRPWQGPQHWPRWATDIATSGTDSIVEIVANLLENAFRYSPPNQSIGLSLLDDGLAVWDSGPPIQEADRDRIFQRGYRGAAGQDRSGTGLGLALARDLAEQHGGSLELLIQPSRIAPELPSRGNAFQLRWPSPAAPKPAG